MSFSREQELSKPVLANSKVEQFFWSKTGVTKDRRFRGKKPEAVHIPEPEA
jgi:hypothetical protein